MARLREKRAATLGDAAGATPKKRKILSRRTIKFTDDPPQFHLDDAARALAGKLGLLEFFDAGAPVTKESYCIDFIGSFTQEVGTVEHKNLRLTPELISRATGLPLGDQSEDCKINVELGRHCSTDEQQDDVVRNVARLLTERTGLCPFVPSHVLGAMLYSLRTGRIMQWAGYVVGCLCNRVEGARSGYPFRMRRLLSAAIYAGLGESVPIGCPVSVLSDRPQPSSLPGQGSTASETRNQALVPVALPCLISQPVHEHQPVLDHSAQGPPTSEQQQQSTPERQQPTSEGQQQTALAVVNQPTLERQQPTPEGQQPTSEAQQPTAFAVLDQSTQGQQPTLEGQPLTSEQQQPSSEGQQPTALAVLDQSTQGQQPTLEGQQPTSEQRQPTVVPVLDRSTPRQETSAHDGQAKVVGEQPAIVVDHAAEKELPGAEESDSSDSFVRGMAEMLKDCEDEEPSHEMQPVNELNGQDVLQTPPQLMLHACSYRKQAEDCDSSSSDQDIRSTLRQLSEKIQLRSAKKKDARQVINRLKEERAAEAAKFDEERRKYIKALAEAEAAWRQASRELMEERQKNRELHIKNKEQELWLARLEKDLTIQAKNGEKVVILEMQLEIKEQRLQDKEAEACRLREVQDMASHDRVGDEVQNAIRQAMDSLKDEIAPAKGARAMQILGILDKYRKVKDLLKSMNEKVESVEEEKARMSEELLKMEREVMRLQQEIGRLQEDATKATASAAAAAAAAAQAAAAATAAGTPLNARSFPPAVEKAPAAALRSSSMGQSAGAAETAVPPSFSGSYADMSVPRRRAWDDESNDADAPNWPIVCGDFTSEKACADTYESFYQQQKDSKDQVVAEAAHYCGKLAGWLIREPLILNVNRPMDNWEDVGLFLRLRNLHSMHLWELETMCRRQFLMGASKAFSVATESVSRELLANNYDKRDVVAMRDIYQPSSVWKKAYPAMRKTKHKGVIDEAFLDRVKERSKDAGAAAAAGHLASPGGTPRSDLTSPRASLAAPLKL